jgi:Protein of unknown function, DUF488
MAALPSEESADSRGAVASIWTVGHSTRGEQEFLDLLAVFRIEAVADVRRFPGSRRQPWFSREALSASLPRQGIDYLWIPQLGGRRKPLKDSPNTAWRNESFRGYADHLASAEFARGLDELLALAARRRTAMMCSEVLWWRCHRALISDVLLCAGIPVIHILDATHSSAHAYSSAARLVNGRLDYSAGLAPSAKVNCTMSTSNSTQPEGDRKADHVEDLIDEAGAESFPASDPPAVTPRRKPTAPQSGDSTGDGEDRQSGSNR